jgi:lipoate-protein ligase A
MAKGRVMVELFNLGSVPWEDSQTLYHALPRLGREGLFLLQPASPYICIGFHQDADQEIEIEAARALSIPIFRREVGGGAVYLNSGQLFYQLVLHSGRVPFRKDVFYRTYLQPVVATLHDLGLDATFRPVNDILVGGRKISGNGAAEIADHVVLVGNILMDFDYAMMARVLRVPDEKFRDKVFKTLEQNLTTLKRELPDVPPLETLSERLADHFETVLGPLTPGRVDANLRAEAAHVWQAFSQDVWTFANDRRKRALRQVTIASGVNVVERVYKSPGGLIRASAVEREGQLFDVHLSGDFFLYPAERLPELEQALEGVPADTAQIEQRIVAFFEMHTVEAPGIRPSDLAQALAVPSSP